jgi:hypothetical protein
MDNARLEQIMKLKEDAKAKTKDKQFKNLSTVEKDALLEKLCKMFGLISN